jgi:RNA polymerase sigma-70 factor (ECF subfamily)
MVLRVARQRRSGGSGGGEPPDDELRIVQLALADRRAFAPLYERYVDPVYRHCFRRLGDREATEDVSAEIFRKALANLHQFTGGSFKGWLFRIADNALNDLDRARRQIEPLDPEQPWRDPNPGPEEEALASFDRDQLRAALARLPEERRRVVELRLDGFSCAQVADILGGGRTAEWVRQAHHRALEGMREWLAEPSEKGGAR